MMSLEREQNFYKAVEVLVKSFITNAERLPINQKSVPANFLVHF